MLLWRVRLLFHYLHISKKSQKCFVYFCSFPSGETPKIQGTGVWVLFLGMFCREVGDSRKMSLTILLFWTWVGSLKTSHIQS